MTAVFADLDDGSLRQLAEMLERTPERFPLSSSDVYELGVSRRKRGELAQTCAEMVQMGISGVTAAWMIRTILEERKAEAARAPKVSPVWSAKDQEGQSQRSLIVLGDLFREAQNQVWLSTYNIDVFRKSKIIFEPLIQRHADGELSVRLFLNIKPTREDYGRSREDVVARFRKKFREQVWKSAKLPEVFYDPSALDTERNQQSCLHAKAVMIDTTKVLITSANFSEAAQLRNIEAGVLIEDAEVTETYLRTFQRLVEANLVLPLFVEDDE